MEIKTEQEFEQVISEGKVLIDFYSNTCPPCRMLAPIIEKFAQEYQGRVTIKKVNVDYLAKIAIRYDIFSIPTLLFFNNGELVNTVVGYRSSRELADLIDKNLLSQN